MGAGTADTDTQSVYGAEVENDRVAVDAHVDRLVRARGLPGPLEEAVQYAVLGPGKRVRPLLCLAGCRAVGGDVASALPAAAALEMVHAFSLVHDDLPAMDDDDLRRGRPTLHRRFDEALAILAGDALQSLAVEALADAPWSAGTARAATAELARATTDMIAGQVYDTLPDTADDGLSDREALERTHRLKTGALIRAACRLGGMAGGAGAASLDALSRYGASLGVLFQVVDDLLDVTASEEELGKAVGKDRDAGKRTYPGILGIDGARAEAQRLADEATAAVAGLGETGEPLRAWVRFVVSRRR